MSTTRTTTTDMTFAALLDRYIEHKDQGIEPATSKSYVYMARRFLRPALGDITLRELRPVHFDCLGQAMKNNGYAASTIKKVVTNAGCALKYAERNEWVLRNVARLAELPRDVPDEIEVPDPADVVKLLDVAAITDPDIRDYAWIMANTGMRPGEVMGLRQSDLDANNVLTIQRAVDVSHCTARIKHTKTNRVRRIAIDDETARVMRSRPGPYLFGGEEPGRTDLLGKRFAKVRRAAGVTFKIRCLRHFHATQLIAAGHSIKDVSNRLGHSNSLITERVYVRFILARDEMLRGSVGSVLDRVRMAVAA